MSRRGALKVRVRTMVESVGVDICRPLGCIVGFLSVGNGWLPVESSATPRAAFLGLHLFEERIQRFEAGLPVLAELLGPEHRVPERRGA